jgi:hypothetical protein
VWFLLAIACSPGVPTGTPPDTSGPPTSHTGGPNDSGAPVVDTAIEVVPDAPPSPHPLFREDVVHELSLDLSSASWDALAADGGVYVPATLADGTDTLEVGVRIKGWTSNQPLTGKPSLKIDIDRQVPGQRYHGLEAFDLHAELTDAAALSEWAAYRIFRDQGLPASRTGWAHLTVNDLDYGFFTIVEKKDDQLIKVWWEDHEGSLYESSSESWPCDLDDPSCDCFEVDEIGSADNRSDLEALCTLAAATPDTTWFDAIQSAVPWDGFSHFMATEIAVGAHDNYAGFSGNFYLYHEPATDAWTFIPSSMNNQFGTSRTAAPTCQATAYTFDDYHHGLLASRCWADEVCAGELETALRDVAGHLASSTIIDDISAAATLIAPYVAADPRTPWNTEQFEGQVACIQDWLRDRPGALLAALPETCLGEGEDLDVQGPGTLSENQRCDRDTPEAPAYGVLSVDGDTVTLSEDAVGIEIGDEVLVMHRQGPPVDEVGAFGLATVQSVSGPALQLSEPFTPPADGGRVSLQRVPSFRDVTVGPAGSLTTGGWDGTAGGVLAFRATGQIRVEAGGRITMDARGYRGGDTGPSSNTDGYQGESSAGTGGGGGTPSQGYNQSGGWFQANSGGGGALVVGGGGEHAGGATQGASWNGDASAPEPGQVQGEASLLRPLMGSGGGGVARIYDHHGPGGAGGGVVLIWADSIEVEGEDGIRTQGEAPTAWTRGTWTYGAGGGAGGSMWLAARAVTLADDALLAAGGSGYTAVDRPGGAGGDGRIRVDCETMGDEPCATTSWADKATPAVGWVGP